jgi:hypothetical protein
MKKLICSTFAALFSSTVICQPAIWTLSEVKGKNEIAGYIYHTNAIGTQYKSKTEKVFTSLRLACSLKSSAPPLMIIMWNTMKGSSIQSLQVTVDGKVVSTDEQWVQDESIIYRSLVDSDSIMQQLKSGNIVTVAWTDQNAIRRTTAFDLRDMMKGMGDFNTICHTRI